MKDLSYEEANNRLEEIIEKMESDSLSLEEMVDSYEEGMALYKLLSEKLNTFEQKVQLLQNPGQGDEKIVEYKRDDRDN